MDCSFTLAGCFTVILLLLYNKCFLLKHMAKVKLTIFCTQIIFTTHLPLKSLAELVSHLVKQKSTLKFNKCQRSRKRYHPHHESNKIPFSRLIPHSRGGEPFFFFSAKGHLGIYNIIHGPCKFINLKISLLCLVKHSIHSPLIPWLNQTKWFCGLCIPRLIHSPLVRCFPIPVSYHDYLIFTCLQQVDIVAQHGDIIP